MVLLPPGLCAPAGSLQWEEDISDDLICKAVMASSEGGQSGGPSRESEFVNDEATESASDVEMGNGKSTELALKEDVEEEKVVQNGNDDAQVTNIAVHLRSAQSKEYADLQVNIISRYLSSVSARAYAEAQVVSIKRYWMRQQLLREGSFDSVGQQVRSEAFANYGESSKLLAHLARAKAVEEDFRQRMPSCFTCDNGAARGMRIAGHVICCNCVNSANDAVRAREGSLEKYGMS